MHFLFYFIEFIEFRTVFINQHNQQYASMQICRKVLTKHKSNFTITGHLTGQSTRQHTEKLTNSLTYKMDTLVTLRITDRHTMSWLKCKMSPKPPGGEEETDIMHEYMIGLFLANV